MLMSSSRRGRRRQQLAARPAATATVVESRTASRFQGGTLTFARSLDAEAGLNPINAPNNGSIFTIQQIFDQLVEVRRVASSSPGLAESWDTSEDGLEWTFHLREAQFSNGDPVTADDVMFSIERFADPKVNVNYATLGEAIESVEVVDDKTVKITLKRVDGAFLDNLAMFAAAIVPQKVVEDVGDKEFAEARSAPARSWSTSSRAASRRCSSATRTTGARASRISTSVVFEFVPDANTRTLQLRSGDVDVADAHPLQPGRVARRDRRDHGRDRGLAQVGLDLPQHQEPPLDEVEVRKALAYATPTRADPRRGPVRQRDRSPTARSRGSSTGMSRLSRIPYDIEQAQASLDESSVPDGFDIELQIPSGDAVEKQTAEIIKSEWAKIGVNVTIAPSDFGTMFGDWLGGKGGQAATFPGDALSSDTLSDDEIAALMYNPAVGPQLARDVLRQPEDHRPARRGHGHARRG